MQHGIYEMINMLKPLAENTCVDVAIHLDHCTDVDFALKCAEAGWSSIMIDASKHSLSDNIKATLKVVEYCHSKNITVEGELGAILGVEDDIIIKEGQQKLADPDDCKVYMAETNVDAFAPAIGTAHGLYEGTPIIDFALFETIKSFASCPLVLHGGTGLSDDVFIKLINLGASKINISTAIKIAYLNSIKRYISKHPNESNPLKLDKYIFDNVKDTVKYLIQLFSLKKED